MGQCFCGCKEKPKPANCFRPGHDRRAASNVVKLKYGDNTAFREHHGYGSDSKTEITTAIVAEYGSISAFVVHHGYGPSGKNLQEELRRFA